MDYRSLAVLLSVSLSLAVAGPGWGALTGDTPADPTGLDNPAVGPARPLRLAQNFSTGLLPVDRYLAVIPSDRDTVPRITRRLQQLGVPDSSILVRSEPRGLHVAVGPFRERGPAETWNRYLRDFGLDSRVYYGR